MTLLIPLLHRRRIWYGANLLGFLMALFSSPLQHSSPPQRHGTMDQFNLSFPFKV